MKAPWAMSRDGFIQWMRAVGCGAALGLGMGQGSAQPWPLFMTEVSASGDWIEIYNAGTNWVNTEGWTAGDMGWVKEVREPMLAPWSYSWVKGLPLSKSGERVRLNRPGTNVVQFLDYPAQIDGFTYGFPVLDNLVFTNAPVFQRPTQGWRNGAVNPAVAWPLILTEIHFRPVTDDRNKDELVQFLEIRNVGTEALNLQGVRLSDGASAVFPDYVLAAGGYALVVRDREAFARRYGPGLPVVADFGTSRLDDDEEDVVLVSPRGDVCDAVYYQDAWNPLADGEGFSLVRRDEATTMPAREAAHWRNSSLRGGSPGRGDPAPAFPRVVINEVLSRPEPPYETSIELRNLEATAVDISGWYLSDRWARPRKFPLPAGTIVPAGGYLALDAHTFDAGSDDGLDSTFSLKATGEELWLFSADRLGQLTGYMQGFRFGAALPNVSFGRRLDSAGREQYVAQSAITLGAPNAAPWRGPVVITEIGLDESEVEFIEILNRSDGSVRFPPPEASGQTYQLAVGTTTYGLYLVPIPEFSLPAGGRALLVSGDAQKFRSERAIAPEVPIVPVFVFSGLNPSNGVIELRLTDTFGVDPWPSNTFRPAIVVDRLELGSGSGWPVARGPQVSLHLRDPESHSGDGTNWVAGNPSPGGAWMPGPAPVVREQPRSLVVNPGAPARFEVVAESGEPMRYQWTLNGATIAGATQSVCVVASTLPRQVGLYRCVVLTASGAAVSDGAVLQTPEFPWADTQAPEVAVTESVSDVTPTGTDVTIYGTARDDVSLVGVVYRRDGGLLEVADGFEDWTIALTNLTAPISRLEVLALDRSGKISATNVLELFPGHAQGMIVIGADGVVQVSGLGWVDGVVSGDVLALGGRHTIWARPPEGQVFVHWTDGEGNVVSTRRSLTFVAGEAMTLVAHFVPEGYYDRLRGEYLALWPGVGTSGAALGTGGTFSVHVGAGGRYSARLRQGRHCVSWSGVIDPGYGLRAARTVPSLPVQGPGGTGGGEGGNELQIAVDARWGRDPGGEVLSGTLRWGATVVPLEGARMTPVRPGRRLVFERTIRGLAVDGVPVPGAGSGSGAGPGTGWNVQVRESGLFQVRGRLPDGARIVSAGQRSQLGSLPIVAWPYRGRGVVVGWWSATPGRTNRLTWGREPGRGHPGFQRELQLLP